MAGESTYVLVTNTLSTRILSISTTSNLRPSQSKFSEALGICPNWDMINPPRVWRVTLEKKCIGIEMAVAIASGLFRAILFGTSSPTIKEIKVVTDTTIASPKVML